MCTAPLIFLLPAPDNLAGGPDSEGVETIVCKTKEHVHYQQIYTTYMYISGVAWPLHQLTRNIMYFASMARKMRAA